MSNKLEIKYIPISELKKLPIKKVMIKKRI